MKYMDSDIVLVDEPMSRKQLKNIAKMRWFKMTLPEQLGNIGSDFERAVRWKEKSKPSLFMNAAERTLELLDLTLADKRWHNHRLKELTRLREEVCNELFIKQNRHEPTNGLQKYFLSMASLARKNT